MMDRISTYTIPADADVLRQIAEGGALPAAMREPFQSLVHRITAAASERPISLYVCSEDDSSEERDRFVLALSRVLIQHIPASLVVDCDFINVGLHGGVPQRDALGFLDLLLYGSSLGVITQDTPSGVPVVGAGSFPVTRRMPFVIGAFEDAARRLSQHARCVLYVGPARGDDEDVHPLLDATDAPVLVQRATAAPGEVRSLEETIASSSGSELLSVHVAPAPVAPEPVVEPPRPSRPPDDREAAPYRAFEPLVDSEVPIAHETPVPSDSPGAPPPVAPEPKKPRVEPVSGFVRLDDTQVDAKRPDQAPRGAPPPGEGGPSRGKAAEPRYTSLVPRLVVAAVGMVTILFVAWWFWQERNRDGLAESQPGASEPAASQLALAETLSTERGESTVVETSAAAVPERPETTAVSVAASPQTLAGTEGEPPATEPPAERTPRPTETGTEVGRGGGTVLIGSEDILVMDDLKGNWLGWHVVHVSSFRKSGEARAEAAYLENQEFPVFIIFLDLDAKGKWYRVYSGPYRSLAEASEVKKNLDDLERVRFTRISKVDDL